MIPKTEHVSDLSSRTYVLLDDFVLPPREIYIPRGGRTESLPGKYIFPREGGQNHLANSFVQMRKLISTPCSCKAYSFKHWQGFSPCDFCPCNRSSSEWAWTNFSTLPFMDFQTTLEEWRTRPIAANAIFKLPGVNLFTHVLDNLHIVDKGMHS